MIDKNFCMSSYLALRYIEKDNMEFYNGLKHENIKLIPNSQKIKVRTAKDINNEMLKTFSCLKEEKLGILLSGGMDSAILASYLPEGTDAYTFRFQNGEFQKDELNRAEYFAKYYKLNLHYVDINWNDTVEKYLNSLMKSKCAPVHSIEPQILQGALQAKADDVSTMIIGESSDLIFGGMDQLLSKDWDYDSFVKRYTFTEPKDVLKNPVSMDYLFERYRKNQKIDFLKFMDDVFAVESSSSYMNAFKVANMKYIDPYAKLKMAEKLDLNRVRNGESKYLIRELFSLRYPEFPVPNKVPMPRPVDIYFQNWKGPTRPEFKDNLDMSKFTGNQKWQLYCLERFLNMYE